MNYELNETAKYPRLMIYVGLPEFLQPEEGEKIIVLMLDDSGSGICIVNTNAPYLVGTDGPWDLRQFEDYRGTVTLSN